MNRVQITIANAKNKKRRETDENFWDIKDTSHFGSRCDFGVVATSLPAVAGDLIADIQKRGTLKVGMSTFVPWAMRDKKGDLIGFEIDVATKLAKDMGVEVEFVPTAWSGIIPALL